MKKFFKIALAAIMGASLFVLASCGEKTVTSDDVKGRNLDGTWTVKWEISDSNVKIDDWLTKDMQYKYIISGDKLTVTLANGDFVKEDTPLHLWNKIFSRDYETKANSDFTKITLIPRAIAAKKNGLKGTWTREK